MKKSRITTALLAIGISASMVFQTPVFATEETAVAVSSGVTTNGISGWPQGPEITSASAVIMEDTSDTILYAKDMDTTLSPAGAVKIMTCLLALENSQLDDQVTMTETGVSGVTDGGAHISSQLGEVFTMEQCLYALMLASNDSFRTISGATSYTIPATNVSGGTRNLTSSFTMTDPASASYYEGCIGGRESTTTASGSVLVTAAQRNGTTLIAVVMNGATGQTANEAISLLDYGFSNFQLLNLSEDDFHILSGGTVMVPSGATADDLTTEDTESDGQILRTYSFGGTQVGTAVVEDSSQESSSDVLENDENMDSAKAYSESRSQIPYFAIGGVGILLLILLLWRMIRIIRS